MSATVTPAATMLRYQFDKEDRIEIAGVAYRFVISNVHGVTFQRADETFIAEHFEHAAISRMLGTGRMRIVRWGFSPEIAERAAKQDVRALSALPPASAKPIENRLPYVLAFLALEDEGLLKRTDDSILANLDAIDRRVTAELRTAARADRLSGCCR